MRSIIVAAIMAATFTIYVCRSCAWDARDCYVWTRKQNSKVAVLVRHVHWRGKHPFRSALPTAGKYS